MADSRTETALDLPPGHIRVAVKWLVYEYGMTTEEATRTLNSPVGRDYEAAQIDAISVATFIVEECHGR